MAKNNPSVSVIVPIYNVEKYIKLCISSILNQTFPDFELILVDDASPDNSIKICNEFFGGNEKIHLLKHKKNLGLGAARNTGLKAARGKYIYFVDSDDVIVSDALEKFYTTAEKFQAEVVHAAARYETFQDDEQPLRVKDLVLKSDPHTEEGFLTDNIVRRLAEHWVQYKTWSMAWLNFCRRDFLAENKIFFENIISEDETFSFDVMCLAKKFFILNAALYVYRRRKNSIIGATDLPRYKNGLRSTITATKHIADIMKKIPALKDNPQAQEDLAYVCTERFIRTHLVQFYDNRDGGSEEISETATKILRPIFGENTQLVKNLVRSVSVLHGNSFAASRQKFPPEGELIRILAACEISPRKIIFVNFNGRGYACNPKYIAEEILRQKLPCDLVWLVTDPNTPMPEKIRKVPFGSPESVYELSSAQVIITNTKNLLPFAKKPEQFYIMTWHGDGAFKCVEKDVEKNLPPEYVAESKATSAMTDLMIAGSELNLKIIRRAFWYDGKISQVGLPRNDIYFRADENFISKLKINLNISGEKKICLYAPTFRDDPSQFAEVYKLNPEKFLGALQKKFGGDWILLIRFHPNIADMEIYKKLFPPSEKILDVTQYPDIQELLVLSDVLLSDYSTVIYDFVLQRKPVFIFAKDFDAYTQERNFYPQFFDLPYPINRTEEELFASIKNFDSADMEEKIQKYLDIVQPYDDGHASEKIVDAIKSAIQLQGRKNISYTFRKQPPPPCAGEWRLK